MRGHTANELTQIADVLGPDGIVRTSIRVGVTDLTGRRLEQAQLVASETSHMIVCRAADSLLLDSSCYVTVDGITYVVDAITDPKVPRPGVWREVYAHVSNGGTPVVTNTYGLNGGNF